MPSAHLPSPLQVQLSLWWEGGYPPSPQLTTLSSTSHPLASLGSSWQERDDTAGEGESRTYAKSYSRARLSLPFRLGLQRPIPAPVLNENANNNQRLGKEQRILSLDPEECRDDDLIGRLLEERRQYDAFHPRASRTAWL